MPRDATFVRVFWQLQITGEKNKMQCKVVSKDLPEAHHVVVINTIMFHLKGMGYFICFSVAT